MRPKTALRETLVRNAGAWLRRAEEELQENEVSFMLLMRLVPAIPFFAVNIAAALLGVRLTTYVWTTLLGIIPGSTVYTWVGAGIDDVIARGETPNLRTDLRVDDSRADPGIVCTRSAAHPDSQASRACLNGRKQQCLETRRPDLCVIGGGSGGLSVAAGAVQMGASVVLVERAKMGGDCLNYGCVPSKALLAAAKHAEAHRTGAPFGVASHEPEVDWAEGQGPCPRCDRRHRLRMIPWRGSRGSGVRVLQAEAGFASPDEVDAGGTRIRARRFILSTGSSPSAPPIPGLDSVPYLTNETVFDNDVRPDRMIVIGAGPIGMEMAQAHRRLGADVVVLEAFRALGRDDPELATVLLKRLRAEGIDIREEVKITGIEHEEGRFQVSFDEGDRLDGSHLLGAAGRRPNLGGLNLEAGNVKSNRAGVEVDATLRSVSNRRVYAIGDVAGGFPVHPCGRLPRRYRDPQYALQNAREGTHRPYSVGHVHRSGDGAGRADRGAGAGALGGSVHRASVALSRE